MSRKTVSFGQLLDYISRTDAKSFTPLCHNLQTSGEEVKKIEKEFLDNYRYCPIRTNGVVLYHDVLAFSGKDQNGITAEVINDLAHKYLELRARNAIAYGIIHFNHTNPHVHFVISGNQVESSRKLRVSKRDFARIQKRLEHYQKERYPELKHSIVFDNPGVKLGQTRHSEYARSRRQREQGRGVPSQKEAVKEMFVYCLLSLTPDEFIKRLDVCDLRGYTRGQTLGIQDINTGRKYRLKTLGLLEEYQKTVDRWNRGEVRKKECESIEFEKVRRQWRVFGFKEQIYEVLRPDDYNGLTEDQVRRIEEMKQIVKDKRQWQRDKGLEL